MKKGWVWVALLLSVGVNVGILATIGASRLRGWTQWERPRQPDRPPPFERLARHLGLQGEPRERFMEIQQGLFRTTLRDRRALESLRDELRREVMSDVPDPLEVERLLTEISLLQADLDRALVESVLATREVLTPEQQLRYFEVVERMRSANRRFGDRRGPAPGRDRRPPAPDRP